MMAGLLNGSCDEAHAKAFGEVPPGASLYELKERAAVAAAKASQHAAAGHKALARIWQKAADRLRKELQERRESEGALGAVSAKRGIPLAHWVGGTLKVGSTPVLSPDQLREGVFGTDKKLGELRRETKNARVWVKADVVTVQWPSTDGGWRTISQYRVPARDSLGEVGELYVGKPTKLAIGLALGAGLYYGGKKLLSKVETSKPATQMRSAIEAAERAEET